MQDMTARSRTSNDSGDFRNSFMFKRININNIEFKVSGRGDTF